eukprot:scaffold171319_cov19-Tisochrysis_lutea.AAC.1
MHSAMPRPMKAKVAKRIAPRPCFHLLVNRARMPKKGPTQKEWAANACTHKALHMLLSCKGYTWDIVEARALAGAIA